MFKRPSPPGDSGDKDSLVKPPSRQLIAERTRKIKAAHDATKAAGTALTPKAAFRAIARRRRSLAESFLRAFLWSLLFGLWFPLVQFGILVYNHGWTALKPEAGSGGLILGFSLFYSTGIIGVLLFLAAWRYQRFIFLSAVIFFPLALAAVVWTRLNITIAARPWELLATGILPMMLAWVFVWSFWARLPQICIAFALGAFWIWLNQRGAEFGVVFWLFGWSASIALTFGWFSIWLNRKAVDPGVILWLLGGNVCLTLTFGWLWTWLNREVIDLGVILWFLGWSGALLYRLTVFLRAQFGGTTQRIKA